MLHFILHCYTAIARNCKVYIPGKRCSVLQEFRHCKREFSKFLRETQKTIRTNRNLKLCFVNDAKTLSHNPLYWTLQAEHVAFLEDSICFTQVIYVITIGVIIVPFVVVAINLNQKKRTIC
ncbi:Zinc finger protein [Dirofilaria immitis]|nr:hypothetical protein [Dirofilaria immitis]